MQKCAQTQISFLFSSRNFENYGASNIFLERSSKYLYIGILQAYNSQNSSHKLKNKYIVRMKYTKTSIDATAWSSLSKPKDFGTLLKPFAFQVTPKPFAIWNTLKSFSILGMFRHRRIDGVGT